MEDIRYTFRGGWSSWPCWGVCAAALKDGFYDRNVVFNVPTSGFGSFEACSM